MVLKSSSGLVVKLANPQSHLWHTFGAKILFTQELILKDCIFLESSGLVGLSSRLEATC